MTIIPYRNEVLLTIYRCPICRGIYTAQIGSTRTSCLVMHPPGSCCHHGEKEIADEEILNKTFELLREKFRQWQT